MLIEKAMKDKQKYLLSEYYYESAREAMYDLLEKMHQEDLLEAILLPGYIGWSAKEGSGIFDPINRILGLTVGYYQMTGELSINLEDLKLKLSRLKREKFAVLIVNYFGFIDPKIQELSVIIKEQGGWLIEDNAHGFFTYHFAERIYSDASFFSLHKMFPFEKGGCLKLTNPRLEELSFTRDNHTLYNPWQYDISSIARLRRSNYQLLENIIREKPVGDLFTPLKEYGLTGTTVPQSFPIKILQGDRNMIYEKMNEYGYGVVSLYHTLISPLRVPEFTESLQLSECIMNLPVHQDVQPDYYPGMIERLTELCQENC